MRFVTGSAVVILLLGHFAARPADAVVVAVPTGPVKAAHADLVVVGKVIQVDEKIEASLAPQIKNKVAYSIAVIQVTEIHKGDAKDKSIKIGFLTAAPVGVKTGMPIIKLEAGQEGVFFLKKHHEGDFHILPMFGAFVSNQNKPAFAKEVDEARQTVKVLANPLAGLKTEDAAKRLETISFLVPVYLTAPQDSTYKMEPLDVEQSKLILKGLLEADWDYKKYMGANFKQNPAKLFETLGIGPKEGFQKPIQGIFSPEYATAAKTWLTKNWQTYRLEKVVVSQ